MSKLALSCDPEGTVAAAARRAVEDATTASAEASLASRAIERTVDAAAETVAQTAAALERTTALSAALQEAAATDATTEWLTDRSKLLAEQVAVADAARAHPPRHSPLRARGRWPAGRLRSAATRTSV